jgi:hypothetical protein
MSAQDGWNGQPPTWDGRLPDLVCDTCSFRYWTFATIKPGAKCPAWLRPNVRCDGRMRIAEGWVPRCSPSTTCSRTSSTR